MHRNSFFNTVEENLTTCLFHQLTDLVESRGRKPFFIEVGANDGVSSSKTFEMISRRGWTGLAIEPVPHVYRQLAANYAPYPSVKTFNLAVADRVGVLPFFQVQKGDDVWYPMLSSFDRATITKQVNLLPDIERHIQEIEVQATTLAELCRANDVGELDLLLIDAEGFDDVIVNTLDFTRHQPMALVLEHKHLTPDRMRKLDRMLIGMGYTRLILWADTAYLRGDLEHDECIQRLVAAAPTLFPGYDPEWGNGYWLDYGLPRPTPTVEPAPQPEWRHTMNTLVDKVSRVIDVIRS